MVLVVASTFFLKLRNFLLKNVILAKLLQIFLLIKILYTKTR